MVSVDNMGNDEIFWNCFRDLRMVGSMFILLTIKT